MSHIVRELVNNNGNLCGLCFERISGNPIRLADEVALGAKEGHKAVAVMLSYVLGDETFKNIAFNEFCGPCVKEAVTTYKFIRKTKERLFKFSYVTENLIGCFEAVPEDLENCKSLFVTFHPEQGMTNQYFDNYHLTDKQSALSRYQSITNMQSVKTKTISNATKKVDHSKLIVIPTKPEVKSEKIDKTDINKVTCPDCMKDFMSVLKLESHYMRVHAPKTFKCDKCPKAFGSKRYLSIHKADYHTNLICSECGKSFKSKWTLREHEKSHYLRIVCQDCGRVYRNKNTFKKHILNDICQNQLRHSPADAKFTCDYCQKKYTQKMTLRVHIQFEHLGYKYIHCKWCDKKFYCRSRMEAHAVKHTKVKNFNCYICNGKFGTKQSLLYHTRIHTGEKPYKCFHCESRFLNASRRAAHMKNYHMDPTVECDICNNKFRSHQYLLKHKKTHQESQVTNRRKLQPKLHETEQNNTSNKQVNIKLINVDNIQTNLTEATLSTNSLKNPKYFYQVDSTGSITPHSMSQKKDQNLKELPSVKLVYQAVEYPGLLREDNYYLEVSDDDDYSMKVSENVEV